MGELSYADTSALRIAYEASGAGGAPVALLLHGWPDDPRTWDRIVPGLCGAGYRCVAPYLRGFGPTRFLRRDRMRCGQIVALAEDARELLDALRIEQALVVGHDWGGRAAYALAALWPERVAGLLALSVPYQTGIPTGDALHLPQVEKYWYQWFFHSERGREALAADRRALCRHLWAAWAAGHRFTDGEFDATAPSWDNPDWVDITLHSYRVRWGGAPRDPQYEALEAALAAQPPIRVPTTVLTGSRDGATLPEATAGQERRFTGRYARRVLSDVGHFPTREQPQAVVEAALELQR